MVRILISACLAGEPTRFDGTAVPCAAPEIARWQGEGRLLPVCPEVAGGCPVPRPPAEIEPGGTAEAVLAGRARIRDRSDADVTHPFIRGAEAALEAAREAGAGLAILKDRSPSCGSSAVHDGTFSGRTIGGRGLTAALLERHGIRVFSESQIAVAAAHLADLEARRPLAPSAR
jgi:uncharacterized protein YbbK (DUF523 family)